MNGIEEQQEICIRAKRLMAAYDISFAEACEVIKIDLLASEVKYLRKQEIILALETMLRSYE